MKYFVHDRALCESDDIGDDSRIWAFAHVLPGARIGRDCNVCDGVFIEDDVVVGDRVTIKCGVQLWNGVRLEDDVFVGPNVTFTNDRFPRSKQFPAAVAQTIVRAGASLGANSTLIAGIEIGIRAMIGAGAVVTRSVPPYAIAVGNPARIVGYVDTENPPTAAERPTRGAQVIQTAVPGVTIHHLLDVKDMRGNLSVGEFERSVPFTPKRYFLVYGVPSREIRGEHAHITCNQFLICVAGSVAVVADDGTHRVELLLDTPTVGIYLPAGVWGIQYKYSSDAVLLVFASEYYDKADYIRHYADFRDFKAKA